MANPLLEIDRFGQSIWYDNLNRALIETKELQRLIDEDAVTGGTSNPSIFEKALSTTDYYEEDLRRLREQRADVPTAFDDLTIRDIQLSSDVLRPIYERTKGADGHASLEVAPNLAYETQATIDNARRLFKELDKPNAMIKIPGTQEGLPAIEQCLSEGININITLLFGLKNYEQVAWAYVSALEKRAQAGEPIDRVGSVASFFVSRVDTLTDKKLQERIDTADSGGNRNELKALLGLAGIANAKIAYAKYKEIFSSARWKALEAQGARVQRCLWASTSTKNPNYRDVMYVEDLMGKDTVNTLPQVTLEAFRDHGVAKATLERDIEDAHQVIARLNEAGIDFDAVTDQLQVEGVDVFAEAFNKASETIEKAIGERITTGS
ncbi:MAG: transaldolase [Chloroflexi bacterium]|nr:transaldolase [Chloroflexota bacterium]